VEAAAWPASRGRRPPPPWPPSAGGPAVRGPRAHPAGARSSTTTPTIHRGAATLRAAREVAGAGRVVAVFQPTCSRVPPARGGVRRRAGPRRPSALLDVYPARERAEDFPGSRSHAGRGGGRRRARPRGAVAARRGPGRGGAARPPAPGRPPARDGCGGRRRPRAPARRDPAPRRRRPAAERLLPQAGRASWSVRRGQEAAPVRRRPHAMPARPARRLAGLLAGLALLGGGWVWVRDSPLVAVRDVQVTGATGPRPTRSAPR
jgi:hypothetical protein